MTRHGAIDRTILVALVAIAGMAVIALFALWILPPTGRIVG